LCAADAANRPPCEIGGPQIENFPQQAAKSMLGLKVCN
jgi:hypothetical protein